MRPAGLEAAEAMADQCEKELGGHRLAAALSSVATEIRVRAGWSEGQVDYRLVAARR